MWSEGTNFQYKSWRYNVKYIKREDRQTYYVNSNLRSKGENMVEIWRKDASCLTWCSQRGARKKALWLKLSDQRLVVRDELEGVCRETL